MGIFKKREPAQVVVTDAAEGPGYVKVTNLETHDERLVEAKDKEGIAVAIDDLCGPYDGRR